MISRVGLTLLAGVCVLGLSACNASSTAGKQRGWSSSSTPGDLRSEDLLDSEGGRWKMVEEKENLSPEQMHARARKVVNPSDLDKHLPSGSNFNPKAEDEDVRVIKMVRAGGSKEEKDSGPLARMMPAKSEVIVDVEERIALAPRPAHKPRREVVEDEPVAVLVASAPKEVATARDPDTDGIGGGGAEIADIRFGDHPGKTRMVLDLTGPAQFAHKIDNGEHILAIEIAGAQWNAGEQSRIMQHALVAGYKAYAVDGATRIALRLKKPVKVVWSAALKPDQGKGDRIVFDLAAL